MILGVPVNNWQWSQAQLPVSTGGLGLRAAEDHAPAAYITSLLSSQDLKESILVKTGEQCPPSISTPLLNILDEKLGEEASVSVLRGLAQREISLKIDLNNL